MNVARTLTSCSTVVAAAAFASALLAQGTLEYQDRGDRWEGIRPKPVSGFDIELISAVVDYRDPVSAVPAQLRVKFFLPKETEAYLTVREQDYRFFYWMDQVEEQWRSGFENEFAWDTAPVLRTLFGQGLKLDDLGALVRLTINTPSAIEHVAPAVLYHSRPPDAIRGYLFTMKTGADAAVKCSIVKEGNDEPAAVQVFRRTRGGRPFTMQWDASNAEAADYRLVASGHFLDDNQPLNQTVRFHHEPRVTE